MRYRRGMGLRHFVAYVGMALLLVHGSKADAVEVNLALGKRCTFSPAPNYSLCTDEGDATQLTDGKEFGSWWTKKSTVGWSWGSTGIEIVVDLEKSSMIDKVKIYTVGGGFANVEFPEFIALLASENGKDYGFVSLIDAEEVANIRSVGHNRVPHTFVLDTLHVKARYVKLVVRPNYTYFFLDEIEVWGQAEDSMPSAHLRKDLIQYKSSRLLHEAIEDFLEVKRTIEATNTFLQKKRRNLSSEFFSKTLSDLESLAGELQIPTKEIYLPGEIRRLQRDVGVLRGSIYKAIHNRAFFCYIANPMDKLLAREMLEVGPYTRKAMEINLWQNEYESSAINILNCSDRPIDMSVSLSPTMSEDGTRIDSNDVYSIRRAIFVKVLGVGLSADPLVLQTDEPFEIEPGATAQIWLTVFGKKLGKGRYHSAVAISGSMNGKDLPIQAFRIDVNIEGLKIPERSSLKACVWDQYTWVSEVTNTDLQSVARDLKSHYVNVGVINPILIPFLRTPYNHKEIFETYLEANDSYEIYLLYLNWWPEESARNSKRDGGRFGEWMSPSWKRNFSLWLRELVKTLRARGIDYDRFAIYPFDESLCDEFYQVAKLVKEFDPKIKIYANSFGRGPKDFMRFEKLVDIWDLHWKHCKVHPDWLEDIKGFGKEVWTYRTQGPSRANDPYSYYRLMSWDAFASGQTGVGFWIYVSRDKQQWNDGPLAKGYYDVVYGQANSPVHTGGEKIIPSRRWESWREGIEDYEYLCQLKLEIEKVRKSDEGAANRAEAVLFSHVKRVVTNREDADLVYEAREMINKILLELKEKIRR
ncbi:MAG: DUF4091 domain-containing protein [Phycisphaerae bacterium]|nr:DUF4091 domain-containing protein [Phycisphaerae bacterium]